jgi:hypothetical protein
MLVKGRLCRIDYALANLRTPSINAIRCNDSSARNPPKNQPYNHVFHDFIYP